MADTADDGALMQELFGSDTEDDDDKRGDVGKEILGDDEIEISHDGDVANEIQR